MSRRHRHIPTDEGWLSLASMKDSFNGEIVGYAMSERMTQTLMAQALFCAVASRRPAAGLIPIQIEAANMCVRYCQKLFKQFAILPSMSRKGNCYDNAPMENFWGSLNNEMAYHRRFATREQTKQEITEYIEIFYNCIRETDLTSIESAIKQL